MKLYLLNKIIKKRNQEATLTYYQFSNMKGYHMSQTLYVINLIYEALFIFEDLSTRMTPEHHRYFINTIQLLEYITLYVF